MLVLSRKVQEGIWVGGNVYITVLSISRGRVKLGIDAPADVHVERSELREAYREQGGEVA
jgi:carbon storage regulator